MTATSWRWCQPVRMAVACMSAAAWLAFAPAAHGQVKGWPSQSPPRALAAREVGFPPYEVRTLANGLRVLAVAHNEQPAITLRLLVGAGSVKDPVGRPGVAALATALLDQGTTTRNARQVAEAVDLIGASLDTGTGRDLTYADLVVLKPDAEFGLSLLSDLVRRTAFAPEEIERQKAQILSGLKVAAEDPEYLADVVFDRLVYGFSPYGYPGNGTAETLTAITRDDLVQYHDRYFVPNSSILAVVGDIGADEAFAAVEKVFGDWARQDLPAEGPVDLPPMAKRVIVIDKPDAVQTEIRVGQLGVPRKHADFLALDMAIRILGGEGANRLHRVLRTERGLTYGVTAELGALRRAGQFVVSTSTRSDATAETLRLVVDEYSRLRRERVDERELSDAKAYLIGNYPLTLETPNDIATHILDYMFYELPLGELQTYRKRVGAISVSDLAEAAWDYVKPERLAVVLVGNASAFAGDLRGAGFGKFERIPIADVDLLAATFRKK